MLHLSTSPRLQQQPSLSIPSPSSSQPPTPSRSLPTPADFKEDQSRYLAVPLIPLSLLTKVFKIECSLVKTQAAFEVVPCEGRARTSLLDIPVKSQAPLEVVPCEGKARASLLDIPVNSQAPLEMVPCEGGARASLLDIPVKSQAALEVVPCEGRVRASLLDIPVKSQAPLEMVPCEEGARAFASELAAKSQAHLEMKQGVDRASSTGFPIKLITTARPQQPFNSWLVVLLFLINLLPTQIFAQINVTEYVTFVGGNDTVNLPPSNTPPNVTPGARSYHAGFYDSSQKCFYTFGGQGGAGNSRHTGTIVSSNFIAALARCARSNFSKQCSRKFQ